MTGVFFFLSSHCLFVDLKVGSRGNGGVDVIKDSTREGETAEREGVRTEENAHAHTHTHTKEKPLVAEDGLIKPRVIVSGEVPQIPVDIDTHTGT